MPDFPIPGGIGKHQVQQLFQVILVGPYQEGTKQDRKCSDSTRFLDGLWVAIP